jgi:hypothetical protein
VNEWYARSHSPDPVDDQATALNESTASDSQRQSRKPRNGHGNGKPASGQSADRVSRIKIPVATANATGAVSLDLPEDSKLAAVETFLKNAEKALCLPRIKIAPAGGIVTVTMERIDPQAEMLLKEALNLVLDAKTRKATLTMALADWEEKAKAAQNAKELTPATPGP